MKKNSISLAEFKRKAASGHISLELIERYGSTNIPLRFKGIRKVSNVNTVALYLTKDNGESSKLRFLSAKLVECTPDELTIYEPGLRDLNEQELEVWNKIKSIYDKFRNTYNGGYWQARDYVAHSPCPWMSGDKVIRGKKYEPSKRKIIDYSIKGAAILKYIIHNEEESFSGS